MKKINRLTKNTEFIKIIKTGKKLQSSFFSFYYLPVDDICKVGISVSKKISTLAVIRNRLKRQIIAVFDQLFDYKLAYHIVIIVKKEILNHEFSEILYQLSCLFNKIK